MQKMLDQVRPNFDLQSLTIIFIDQLHMALAVLYIGFETNLISSSEVINVSYDLCLQGIKDKTI